MIDCLENTKMSLHCQKKRTFIKRKLQQKLSALSLNFLQQGTFPSFRNYTWEEKKKNFPKIPKE